MFYVGFEKIAVGSKSLEGVLNHAYGDLGSSLAKKMKSSAYQNLPMKAKSSFESRLSGLYERNEKARSLMSKYENVNARPALKRDLMRTVIKDVRESHSIPKSPNRMIPNASGKLKYLAIGGFGLAAAAGLGYLASKRLSSESKQPEAMVNNNYEVPDHIKKDPGFALLAPA